MSTHYIQENYLTIEQLVEQTRLSCNVLFSLINNACIPKHSHTITYQVILHTDIFGEYTISQEPKYYYHPSLVQWAIKANQYAKTHSLAATADKMKQDFIDELAQTLSEHNEAKEFFPHGIESIMAEHWHYVLDGTYGVCLKEISAKNVILKTIVVAKLKQWIDASEDDRKLLLNETHSAMELYDEIAAVFGPHELEKSTRGRLFDSIKKILA